MKILVILISLKSEIYQICLKIFMVPTSPTMTSPTKSFIFAHHRPIGTELLYLLVPRTQILAILSTLK